MAQEFKSVGIIGAGPAGCVCAYFLSKSGIDVTLFDYGSPLRTLLPTGGGRCNLAHAEYDFKDLAKNYPRGEKFLYSVLSRFSTYDTIDFFKSIGIETYVQEDYRIFPTSNSSTDVREKILNNLKNIDIVKEKVLTVKDNKIKTDKAEYLFSDIVISTGGRNFNIKGLEKHNIIPFSPSLVGLNSNICAKSGISCKNVYSNDFGIYDDILFTHWGLSGPLIYKISSIKAKDEFPYTISLDFSHKDIDLQKLLEKYPHRDLKNIISKEFDIPINLVKYLLGELENKKACETDGKTRDYILDRIHNFKAEIISANKGEETVSAGGIDLDEINPRTMESKIYPHVYFIGEVLNIDGFCGGFNLQNCWSTAFVASNALIENLINT